MQSRAAARGAHWGTRTCVAITPATSASTDGSTAAFGTSSDGANWVTYAAAGGGSSGATSSSTNTKSVSSSSVGQSTQDGVAWGEVEADDEPSAHGSHLALSPRLIEPGWFSSVTTWAWDTGQWTWEVGSAVLGLAQGGANTINVVHDGR